MAGFKIGICEPDHFSAGAISILKSIGEVSFFNKQSIDDLKLFVSDKSAIFVRLCYKINDDLLFLANSLKYICSPTTGLNHISVSDKYTIVSLKGEYEFLNTIRATPEHVFGLTISLLRNYQNAFRRKGHSDWNRDLYRGYELYQNKVGIIGMGRIGKILSGYYKAFGAEVFYYDKNHINDGFGIECANIEELCTKTNIILLETDYCPENSKMIGRNELALLQGKYFVNAARGELVDEDALIKLIKDDYFAGVALDVISEETSENNNMGEFVELTDHHNFILTPHIGGATFTSMERTEIFIAEKLKKMICK